ncbi:MAG: hypothetical protein ACM3XR_03185 [Bacillota bacterium]
MKMYLKAAFKFKNIIMLAAGAVLAAGASSYAPGMPWLAYLFGAAGIGAYAAGVISTIGSGEFREELELSEALGAISRLSRECNRLYWSVAGRLERSQRAKAARIIRQKESLMKYFDKYCEDPIKQRIIEQALKLVIAYLKLAASYSERARELSQRNLDELASRINENNRKLGSLKNYEAVLELMKTVEMDEKLLKSLKEEREQLEMVNVRLDQIESVITGFKHRILSNDFSGPESEKIENTINEAVALDNVLSERSMMRRRL